MCRFFSMTDSVVKECPKSSAGFCHHRRVNQEWPERQCMLEEVNRSLSYCESAFWGWCFSAFHCRGWGQRYEHATNGREYAISFSSLQWMCGGLAMKILMSVSFTGLVRFWCSSKGSLSTLIKLCWFLSFFGTFCPARHINHHQPGCCEMRIADS